MYKIVVVTHSPSPYQVELFDAIDRESECSLKVIYLYAADPARSWSQVLPKHEHWVVTGEQLEIPPWEVEADLLVINYYRHPVAAHLMQKRAKRRAPWVFWGERPGFKQPIMGRLARLWYLRALHRSKTPIWGVGEYAIHGYRREFGEKRQYVNLPYFSELRRFSKIGVRKRAGWNRVVLFSGALIPRKGVDLLARAFVAVARQYLLLRLHILGSGELENELRTILAPVAEQVNFFGFKDWKELPGVYASADVLCVPSRYDGWGLVVPEGLAAGLPVIATNRMGAAIDLVKDGENGWMLEAGDLHELEDVLHKVATLDSVDLLYMSSLARRSVEDHSLSSGAERFIAACRAAVENWAC